MPACLASRASSVLPLVHAFRSSSMENVESTEQRGMQRRELLARLADEAARVVKGGRGFEQHVAAFQVGMQHAQRVQVVHAGGDVNQAAADGRLRAAQNRLSSQYSKVWARGGVVCLLLTEVPRLHTWCAKQWIRAGQAAAGMTMSAE